MKGWRTKFRFILAYAAKCDDHIPLSERRLMGDNA